MLLFILQRVPYKGIVVFIIHCRGISGNVFEGQSPFPFIEALVKQHSFTQMLLKNIIQGLLCADLH